MEAVLECCCGLDVHRDNVVACILKGPNDQKPERAVKTFSSLPDGEQKTCPICGTVSKAAFPEDVNQPVQYGPLVRALATYMNQYQFLPYDRTCEFFKDLFGQPFSEGSLFTANQELYESLTGFEQEVKRQLLNEPVINCDETGARVEGKNHWLHVACTPKLTCYGIHPKRGTGAMDELGILPSYTGIAKHDCLHAYFKYPNYINFSLQCPPPAGTDLGDRELEPGLGKADV